MAKKNLDTALEKVKLDLGKTLNALNNRDLDYYAKLSDEEKKKYAPIVLMRYMSSAPNQKGLHEAHLVYVNELVNDNFWSLTKFPEFQHMLLATCGLNMNVRHDWIAMPKRKKVDGLRDYFKQIYPDLNDLEYQLVVQNTSSEEFVETAKSRGILDKEVGKLLEQFKYAKGEE